MEDAKCKDDLLRVWESGWASRWFDDWLVGFFAQGAGEPTREFIDVAERAVEGRTQVRSSRLVMYYWKLSIRCKWLVLDFSVR